MYEANRYYNINLLFLFICFQYSYGSCRDSKNNVQEEEKAAELPLVGPITLVSSADQIRI